MAFLRPSTIRAFTAARTITRPALRPAAVRPCGRRGYADPKAHEANRTSDMPWLVISAAVTIPTLFVLLQSRPERTPHRGHDHQGGAIHHEERTEKEEEEAQTEPAASEAAKEPEESQARAAYVEEAQNQNPAAEDPAAAVKWPGGPSTTSGKQEGLSNDGTSNPGVTREELSKKGEQDVDSAKLRGSVDRERPQV